MLQSPHSAMAVWEELVVWEESSQLKLSEHSGSKVKLETNVGRKTFFDLWWMCTLAWFLSPPNCEIC